MTYVITEPCIGVKEGACVDVCPAACIHTTPEAPQHYIDPDICIECEQCVLVCPVNAIFLDKEVPDEWQQFTDVNAAFFRANKALQDVPLHTAEAMVQAVKSYAARAGLSVAAVVVGRTGNVLTSALANGADEETLDEAERKAYTAVMYRLPTVELRPGARQTWVSEMPIDDTRILLAPGGHPMVEAGDIIGAVGVAGGGSREQDIRCCQAALGVFFGPSH